MVFFPAGRGDGKHFLPFCRATGFLFISKRKIIPRHSDGADLRYLNDRKGREAVPLLSVIQRERPFSRVIQRERPPLCHPEGAPPSLSSRGSVSDRRILTTTSTSIITRNVITPAHRPNVFLLAAYLSMLYSQTPISFPFLLSSRGSGRDRRILTTPVPL